MAEKVCKLGIKREPGFMYYLSGSNVMRTPMMRGGRKEPGEPTLVSKCGFKREQGFLYYLDDMGDVSRAKQMTGGAGRKPKAEAKVKPPKVEFKPGDTVSFTTHSGGMTKDYEGVIENIISRGGGLGEAKVRVERKGSPLKPEYKHPRVSRLTLIKSAPAASADKPAN